MLCNAKQIKIVLNGAGRDFGSLYAFTPPGGKSMVIQFAS